MERDEKERCRLGDTVYPDGSEVCCEGYCQVCRHGQWIDTAVDKDSY